MKEQKNAPQSSNQIKTCRLSENIDISPGILQKRVNLKGVYPTINSKQECVEDRSAAQKYERGAKC
jgi:hypothetical protein